MTMIKIITWLIQSICMASVVATAFEKKREMGIVLSFLFLCLNYFYPNHLWMLFVVIFLMESFIEKKWAVGLAVQMVLANLLHVFCRLVSYLLISLLLKLPIMVITLTDVSLFQTSLVYWGMFVALATLIDHFDIQFNKYSYKIWIGLLMMIIYDIIAGFLSALTLGNITLDDIQHFSISFIAFGIVLLVLMYLVHKETRQNLDSERFAIQERLTKNNMMLLEGIKSNIDDMEHRMNYVLLSLKYSILDNNKQQALALIQENTWQMKKVSHYVNTNNPYFDQLLSHVLKDFHQKGVIPACIFEVKKGQLDEDITRVSLLIEVLSQWSSLCQLGDEVNIHLQLKSTHLLLKIVLKQKDVKNFEIPQVDYFKMNDVMLDDSTIEVKYLGVNKDD